MIDLKSRKTFFSKRANTATARRLTKRRVTTFINRFIITQLKFPFISSTLTAKGNKAFSLFSQSEERSYQRLILLIMLGYVSDDINKIGESVDLHSKYKRCLFLPKDQLNFVHRAKKRQKHHLSEMPANRPTVHLSQKQQINIIKSQIERLRTQSPHLLMPSPENIRNSSSMVGISISKLRKRDDLAKIVLARLKRQKSKQYLRKIKKSQSFLPKLDMEGKSCWLPKRERYINPISPKGETQIFPINSVVKIKQRLKGRPEKNKITSTQTEEKNKRDRSVCGWEKSFNPQDITQFLID